MQILLLRQAMRLLQLEAHPPEGHPDPEPFQVMLNWEASTLLLFYFLESCDA